MFSFIWLTGMMARPWFRFESNHWMSALSCLGSRNCLAASGLVLTVAVMSLSGSAMGSGYFTRVQRLPDEPCLIVGVLAWRLIRPAGHRHGGHARARHDLLSEVA